MQTHVIDITTTFNDIPHLAVSLWYSGCNIKCNGCHNTALEDFRYGLDLNEIEVTLKERRKLTEWVVHIGGNPLDSIADVIVVSELAKQMGFQQFLYSGYEYNEFQKMFPQYIHRILLKNIRYIKTGKYNKELSKKNCKIEGTNYFFESLNQEVYRSCDYHWEKQYGFDWNKKTIYGHLLI